jgi:retinol dehydrogenase 14
VKNLSGSVDLLILNAGLTTVTRRLTKQGHEMMLGSMHLGHTLMTHLMLPKMPNGSRIVVVGSHAHKWGKIDFEDMKSEKYFSAFPMYCRAKLCNLHFTRSLAKLLRSQNRDITVNCCHPGFIASGLSREGGVIVDILSNLACKVFGKTAERGAQTTVYAAISSELKDKSGLYLSECRADNIAAHVTEEVDNKLWTWTLQQLSIDNFGAK